MAKTAFITGASSGIGQATALAMARAGYDLMLLARREDRLESVAREVQALGRKVRLFAVDVRDRKQVDDLIQSEAANLRSIDVLVNNAGLARGRDKIQDGRLTDWDEMIDVNIKGVLALTRGILPFMIANKKGHVVNLGSVAGRWLYQGGAVYCATKHAVRAISEGLRMDLMGTGIRVTDIEPGMVKTEFSIVRAYGDEKANDSTYDGMTPLSAQDIADTILWCVLRPDHVNIQELVIYPTDQAAIGMVHRK